ncbi:MAG: hypothetical protein LZF61_10580 [Nitrosomonas sp.]|nr:MAG: hypothetical protein LZF61_10580 [Nitrosomonas sp.]
MKFTPTASLFFSVREQRIVPVACAMICSALIAGCGIGDSVNKITKSVDKVTETIEDATNKASDIAGDTVATLDEGIDALERNSASWQSVLQQMTKQLTDDAQSTVRNEISALLNRSVAATGTELRCDLDFIGARVHQGLVRIRAHLLNQPLPPLEPALCHVVPPAVDMALDTSRRNKVEIFGYDFDTTPIKVKLHDQSQTKDVSSHLNVLTHYHMMLNLGGNGVPVTKTSHQLTLEWENEPISSIAVIQPATPVCQEKLHTVPPSAKLSFTPPHVQGNKDFSGKGPEVWANARWTHDGKSVKLRLWMKAQQTDPALPSDPFKLTEALKEIQKGLTKAEGVREEIYFTAPTGWRIERIEGNTESSAHYIDSDHNEDRQGAGPNGPAKEFVFRGDHKGNDAGSYTGVDVHFNPLVVKLVEVADCAPASAIRSLKDIGQLSTTTIKRLNPTLMKLQLHKIP